MENVKICEICENPFVENSQTGALECPVCGNISLVFFFD